MAGVDDGYWERPGGRISELYEVTMQSECSLIIQFTVKNVAQQAGTFEGWRKGSEVIVLWNGQSDTINEIAQITNSTIMLSYFKSLFCQRI